MSPPGGVTARLPPRPPTAHCFVVSFVNKYGGGLATTLWQKFMQFEYTENTFEHFLDPVNFKLVDNLPTGLAADFVNAGLLSKNILLLRDMKYMSFYRSLPGICKYFFVAGVS